VTYGPAKVTIIDPVADYLSYLEEIFDFPLMKSFLHDSPQSKSFKVLFDGMHGVTGPYARAIFVGALGLPQSSIQNCEPLPDFGGGHPDPNLIYAHTLVDAVEKGKVPFGAASDGDGDRNMIYGAGAFVTPGDSVAIIADWAAEAIPYFKSSGIKGLARSMPTSKAIDLVAKEKGFECFEVPTGARLCRTTSSSVLTGMQAGSSSATSWTPAACPSAARSRSVPAPTTSARRTACGRSSHG
jgi:phosphoglucomutase